MLSFDRAQQAPGAGWLRSQEGTEAIRRIFMGTHRPAIRTPAWCSIWQCDLEACPLAVTRSFPA